MTGFLYIDADILGEADFEVTDESMGAIGGMLLPAPDYKKYRTRIQNLYRSKGIANVNDFTFRIILIDNTILYPEGGIGVTDSPDFDEIYVESAGLPYTIISKIGTNQV